MHHRDIYEEGYAIFSRIQGSILIIILLIIFFIVNPEIGGCTSESNLKYGININNFRDGDRVARVIPLVGTYPDNSNNDIWIFVVAPNGRYYPQSIDPCNESWRTPKEDGRWEMWVGLGSSEDVNGFFDIVLAVADSEASREVSSKVKEWCESNYYPGFEKLPPGVREMNRVTVIRNAEIWGPAPEISTIDLIGVVSLTNMIDGNRVPQRMNIIGNSSLDIEGELWVLVYAPNGRWYPQSTDPCNGVHVKRVGTKWEVPASFGGETNSGEAFDVVIVLANATASDNLSSRQGEWCRARDYPGFLTIELPPGLDEKDRVRVYRSSDRWGFAPDISTTDLPGDARFINIQDNIAVPQHKNLIGNSSSDLEGELWVLVYAPNGQWYPQSTDPCNGVHVKRVGTKWEVPASFGGETNSGEAFDVVIVLANATASDILSSRQGEWCRARDYPGFLTIELPPGLDEKDRVRVYRSSDRWVFAPEISTTDLSGDARFINIQDNIAVPQHKNLIGNSSSDLEGELWVLVYAPNGRWYPQSTDPCNGVHVKRVGTTWEVPASFGGENNSGEAFDVVIVLANATASDILSSRQGEWCRARDYPGFLTIELPPGLDEKDRVRVYRSSDRWGLAPEIEEIPLVGDVSITNIEDGDRVRGQMDLFGDCSSDLEGDIWALVYAPNGRWYPQSTNPWGGVHVQKAGERWRVRGIFGGDYDSCKAFDVVIVLANDTASSFFNKIQTKFCEEGDYPGFLTIELPPGIDVKDRVRVFRR